MRGKHEFDSDRKGLCKTIVGAAICGEAKEHAAHFTDLETLKRIVDHGVKFCGNHLQHEIFPKHYEFCPYCGGDLETVQLSGG